MWLQIQQLNLFSTCHPAWQDEGLKTIKNQRIILCWDSAPGLCKSQHHCKNKSQIAARWAMPHPALGSGDFGLQIKYAIYAIVMKYAIS